MANRAAECSRRCSDGKTGLRVVYIAAIALFTLRIQQRGVLTVPFFFGWNAYGRDKSCRISAAAYPPATPSTIGQNPA